MKKLLDAIAVACMAAGILLVAGGLVIRPSVLIVIAGAVAFTMGRWLTTLTGPRRFDVD